MKIQVEKEEAKAGWIERVKMLENEKEMQEIYLSIYKDQKSNSQESFEDFV